MKNLCFSGNQRDGNVDLTKRLLRMENLVPSGNPVTGNVNLSRLPAPWDTWSYRGMI